MNADVPVEYQAAYQSILRARERAKKRYEAKKDEILQKHKERYNAKLEGVQRRPRGRPPKTKEEVAVAKNE